MSQMFFFIDAGHGGVTENNFYVTPGKRSPEPPPNGIYEGQFNRTVANMIDWENSDPFITTQLTVADSPINIPNKSKVRFINKVSRTLPKYVGQMVIAIHADAMGMGKEWNEHSGFKVLVPANCKKSERFARIILEKMADACPYKSKGIRVRNDLAILRGTRIPSVLIECGHMTNKKDTEFLNSKEGPVKIVNAILAAMTEWRNHQ